MSDVRCTPESADIAEGVTHTLIQGDALKVSFCLQDEAMPRTEYWQQFITAMRQSDFFTEGNADILVPNEDTAMETNWPRYGNMDSAYIRGDRRMHEVKVSSLFHRYFLRAVEFCKSNQTKKILYINMHPFFRPPLLLRGMKNVIVADVSLAMFERNLNRNTISMPTLPIAFSNSPKLGLRPVIASFQGRNSHPIRDHLKQIANDKTIIINFVGQDHFGKLDATSGRTDHSYYQLLESSTFAFIPRGDALFSYRLIEAMSFGCIPIILSDGWVLPFDRVVPWERMSLRMHADGIPGLPQILSSLSNDEILERQNEVIRCYRKHFADIAAMIASLFTEVERLRAS